MIDPDVAVGARLADRSVAWDVTDVLRYQVSLGIGSGSPSGGAPTDPDALSFTLEPSPQVLPTFAVMPARLRATEPVTHDYPGVCVDPARVLHGSQSVVLHRRFPAAGTALLRTGVVSVADKGTAAVLTEQTDTLIDGQPVATATSELFCRDAGGFSGDRGPARPPAPVLPPEDPAVCQIPVHTHAGQALLYRLCGDRNPLHVDPAYARRAGLARPVLHGLCTWGMVCHALVRAFCASSVGSVRGFSARFTGVVYPGDALMVRAVDRGDDVVAQVVVPGREDALVLDAVRLTRR